MHDTQDEQLSECMADLYLAIASVLIEASDGGRGAKAICINRVMSRRNDRTHRCHLKGLKPVQREKGTLLMLSR